MFQQQSVAQATTATLIDLGSLPNKIALHDALHDFSATKQNYDKPYCSCYPHAHLLQLGTDWLSAWVVFVNFVALTCAVVHLSLFAVNCVVSILRILFICSFLQILADVNSPKSHTKHKEHKKTNLHQ